MSDDRIYLLHILDAIERITEDVGEGEETFFADRRIQDAVVRNLTIIGEAVKNLSAEIREAHPDTPWRQIAGMRDRLIHGYFSVDLKLVFEVARRDLPPLKATIEGLLR